MKNYKYSDKIFSTQTFTTIDPKEFSGMIIENSDFSQNVPYSAVFPEGITDIEFRHCNLLNCILPKGAVTKTHGVNPCLVKHADYQNDLEMWEVDTKLAPIKPMLEKKFISLGISKSPKDIPSAPLPRAITDTKLEQLYRMKEKEYGTSL